MRLSIESANRVLIIKKLVGMLQNVGRTALAAVEAEAKAEEQEQQEQEQAAEALANLANDADENRVAIVEAGGIEPLLALLGSASVKARESSVRAHWIPMSLVCAHASAHHGATPSPHRCAP